MPTPLGYSGQRAGDAPVPPRRASDSDAWLVYAALRDYAVPVEKVVRTHARLVAAGNAAPQEAPMTEPADDASRLT